MTSYASKTVLLKSNKSKRSGFCKCVQIKNLLQFFIQKVHLFYILCLGVFYVFLCAFRISGHRCVSGSGTKSNQASGKIQIFISNTRAKINRTLYNYQTTQGSNFNHFLQFTSLNYIFFISLIFSIFFTSDETYSSNNDSRL